jgi:hypothetical protein
MLSEIVASRVALADRPATPALSDEEIVMDTPFCCLGTKPRQQISGRV